MIRKERPVYRGVQCQFHFPAVGCIGARSAGRRREGRDPPCFEIEDEIGLKVGSQVFKVYSPGIDPGNWFRPAIESR